MTQITFVYATSSDTSTTEKSELKIYNRTEFSNIEDFQNSELTKEIDSSDQRVFARPNKYFPVLLLETKEIQNKIIFENSAEFKNVVADVVQEQDVTSERLVYVIHENKELVERRRFVYGSRSTEAQYVPAPPPVVLDDAFVPGSQQDYHEINYDDEYEGLFGGDDY